MHNRFRKPLDVLIVEDHRPICDQMADFLSRGGLTVLGSYSAEEALAVADEYQPRVLILDYNLPGIDGVELARQLRATLEDAAIIMMSGRIEGISERTLADVRINVFLNKPVPLVPLRRAVERLARADAAAAKPAGPSAGGWLSTGLGGKRD
jgi:DNA-binding response OmpR family regulator